MTFQGVPQFRYKAVDNERIQVFVAGGSSTEPFGEIEERMTMSLTGGSAFRKHWVYKNRQYTKRKSAATAAYWDSLRVLDD